MSMDSHSRHPVTLAAAAAILVLTGGAIGYFARGEDSGGHSAGEALKASEIGSVTAGRRLFTSTGCVACHSFEGRGGKDAPPLDFMRGRMSATDIASMSGRVWNHTPAMQKFFKEEGIKFPTFNGNQMADLIAYLHAGGSPPIIRGGMMGGDGR